MKPVIKKQTIYSLLLMRDDCSVRRFRVRAFWLKFLCTFLILVFVGAGLAGYLAHNYRKKYNELQDEHRSLERQLAETRRRLEPLAYLEKIQEVSQQRFAVDGATPSGSAGTPGAAGATGAGHSGPNGVSSVSSVVPVVPASSGSGVASSGVGGIGGNQTAAGHRPSAAGNASLGVWDGNQTGGGMTGLAGSSGAVDTGRAGNQTDQAGQPDDSNHPAKITNVSLRASGATRIRMSFDLSNQHPQQTLNGRVSLAVITNAGAVVEVTQADRIDLSFLIARYKKISTTFTLPQNIQATDVASVQITLSGDNVPRYSERFPLQ